MNRSTDWGAYYAHEQRPPANTIFEELLSNTLPAFRTLRFAETTKDMLAFTTAGFGISFLLLPSIFYQYEEKDNRPNQ